MIPGKGKGRVGDRGRHRGRAGYNMLPGMLLYAMLPVPGIPGRLPNINTVYCSTLHTYTQYFIRELFNLVNSEKSQCVLMPGVS